MENSKKLVGIALAFLVSVTGVFALGNKDGGGQNVVIGNWWADWDVNTRTANSTAEEQLIAHRKKVLSDNNLKISEKNISSWEQMLEIASTSIMSGTPAAQVFVLQPNWALALYNQGLLAPISDVKSVNLKSTKPVEWNQDTINTFTFKGKAYAFSVGYGTSQHANGVFFNKRLFAEAGLNPNLPYDLQKAGTWTWDAYLDICKKLTRDTNNDGIIDVYAIASVSTETLDAIAASNYAGFVDKNAQGNFVNATGRPEFLQALQYAVRLNTEGTVMPYPEGANWDWFKAAFHDGKAAMRIDAQYVAQELRDMKDDYGFVLFPKGPRAKDYRFASDENVYVIPSTYKPAQIEQIMQAVYLWSTPAPGQDAPDAWKAEQYANYRDERAVDETLAMIRDPKYGSMKYAVMIPGLERGDIAWNMWFDGVDPAQLIESVSQSWNHIIAAANKK